MKSLAGKVYRRLQRFLPERVHRPVPPGEKRRQASPAVDWNERARFLDVALPSPDQSRSQRREPPHRVIHLIGSLQPGGAERQLCNCAIGQRQLGYDVSVLLLSPPEDEHDHYGDLLASGGVPVEVAGRHMREGLAEALKHVPGGQETLRAIPNEFCPFAIDVCGELLAEKPDVFHSWLDHPNIWGGVGALLARVPLIVLSTRNVNPTHFPYLMTPYFHAMYSQFSTHENIRFINNSRAGAEDYAQWLGLPKERFAVVLNGVDFTDVSRASESEIAAFRAEIGVPPDAQIIAGVFRLSEEKQPLTFLEVARRLIDRGSNVYVVVAGIGPYEKHMKEFISQYGLTGRVILLGRRVDISTIFSAACFKMLCSLQEGTPNVLLEAQWLGCPVVSTRAGGAVDAVADGRTGILVNVGDVEAIEAAAIRLLEEDGLRARFAEQGPIFIKDSFSVERMVRETVSLYHQ